MDSNDEFNPFPDHILKRKPSQTDVVSLWNELNVNLFQPQKMFFTIILIIVLVKNKYCTFLLLLSNLALPEICALFHPTLRPQQPPPPAFQDIEQCGDISIWVAECLVEFVFNKRKLNPRSSHVSPPLKWTAEGQTGPKRKLTFADFHCSPRVDL